jgi:hypothetical protein
MQIFQGENEFCGVELALKLREVDFLNEMMAQIFSAAEIES